MRQQPKVQHHILGIQGNVFSVVFRLAQARSFGKKIMGKITEPRNLRLNILLKSMILIHKKGPTQDFFRRTLLSTKSLLSDEFNRFFLQVSHSFQRLGIKEKCVKNKSKKGKKRKEELKEKSHALQFPVKFHTTGNRVVNGNQSFDW